MIETTVEFKGLDQLDAALKELPVQMQRQVLRTGLTWAARVIKEGMMRRAPRAAVHRVTRGGSNFPTPLFDSIRIRVKFRRDGDPTASIGPSGRAFWGRFVELGTKFQAARPFMRPSLQEDGQIAVAAFAAGARDKLEKLVRSAKRGAARRGESWD